MSHLHVTFNIGGSYNPTHRIERALEYAPIYCAKIEEIFEVGINPELRSKCLSVLVVPCNRKHPPGPELYPFHFWWSPETGSIHLVRIYIHYLWMMSTFLIEVQA